MSTKNRDGRDETPEETEEREKKEGKEFFHQLNNLLEVDEWDSAEIGLMKYHLICQVGKLVNSKTLIGKVRKEILKKFSSTLN